MKDVRVNLGVRSYDILIGESILANLGTFFAERKLPRQIFLITNPVVFDLYGADVLDSLSQEAFDTVHLLIPDGERAKNLDTAEKIYTYLIAQRADRSVALVALGGGVTGDIVGFVAATYLRGVSYVQLPTTLLAQVDSSVGGKTGVNHRLGKNLIGAFHQPDFVAVDTVTLDTLPDREFRAGVYEVVKYGLIYDENFFEYLEEAMPKLLQKDRAVLESVISRCCEIKAEVITIDEREQNLRRILNFGHTLGHALEAATDYGRFLHGEAVAYGMIAATFLSQRVGLISEQTVRRVVETVARIGPLPSASDVSFHDLQEAIALDKKRHDNQIVFVLLRSIGETEIRSGLPPEVLAEVWASAVSAVDD